MVKLANNVNDGATVKSLLACLPADAHVVKLVEVQSHVMSCCVGLACLLIGKISPCNPVVICTL